MGYTSVQLVFRQSANDPQVQMAEDAAAKIGAGRDLRSVVSTEKVELSKSLAPFLMVFDASGNVVVSSGLLDGKVTPPPPGVINTARTSGSNRVTWQPRSGVRIAAVIVKATGSGIVILAGRSLREVEQRVSSLALIVFLGWLAALMSSAMAVAFVQVVNTKRQA